MLRNTFNTIIKLIFVFLLTLSLESCFIFRHKHYKSPYSPKKYIIFNFEKRGLGNSREFVFMADTGNKKP